MEINCYFILTHLPFGSKLPPFVFTDPFCVCCRSLAGIRIIHAAARAGRTMLISDSGHIYAFGKDSFGEAEYGAQGSKQVNTPQIVESLKDIFIVQAAIGNFFTAVLSQITVFIPMA
ncbi:putative regulator of chromosome condensation 1/beta-lactamase-inhibitor protein II [Helianthus anomalus]